MPRTLKICSLEPGLNCIMLLIHLKTTDTMEEALSEAMVDTGDTGDFIDQDFVRNTKLPTHELSQPIPVYNVNGTPNEAGSIHKVVDMIMTYGGHSEQILLAVTQLRKQSMILWFSWLKKHNPEIDFHAGTINIEDAKDELKDGEFEVPLEEEVETPLDEDDEPLEEGDHIWATGLFPEAEQIQATASISQRLAEGF